MKKLMNWKTGCAMALVAVILVSGLAAAKVNAASNIDMDRTATIAIGLPEEEKITLEEMKELSFSVSLYKVADVNTYGVYSSTMIDHIENYTKAADAETIKGMIDTAAAKVEGTKADYEGTFDINSAAVFEIPSDKFGVYLVQVDSAKSEGFQYNFSNSLVAVPGNSYITGEDTTNDDWLYDYKIEPKFDHEELFGDLVINKTVETFNTSLNETSFVYQVTATKDYSKVSKTRGEEVVYNNVVAINANHAGNYSVKINDIPAGAKVTVSEVYTGATYKLDNSAKTVSDISIIADGTEEVAFASYVNTYDDTLTGNGTAVINQFTNNVTEWTWSEKEDSNEYE